MKKVGIIGGAGPLASSLLYEMVVRECYDQGGEIPEMLILNFPFTRCLTRAEESTNFNRVLEELRYCVLTLEKNGVDIGVVACNTLHLFLKKLPQPAIEFNLVPDLVIAEAKRRRARRLLILGSENTCLSSLYQDPALIMLYPSKEEQRVIDKTIDHVLQGNVLEEDSNAISKLLAGCRLPFDGVVLGCTDLPVVHHRYPIESKAPIYDSIKITSKKIRGSL